MTIFVHLRYDRLSDDEIQHLFDLATSYNLRVIAGTNAVIIQIPKHRHTVIAEFKMYDCREINPPDIQVFRDKDRAKIYGWSKFNW